MSYALKYFVAFFTDFNVTWALVCSDKCDRLRENPPCGRLCAIILRAFLLPMVITLRI